MAEPSELRNLIARADEALALAKQNAECKSNEIEAKYRDEPRAIFVRWVQPIFIGGTW